MTPNPETSAQAESHEPAKVHALAGVRKQFLAIDIVVIGFLAVMIGWTLLSTVLPGLRLYDYSARYSWAEIPKLKLAGQLMVVLGIYMFAQRLGLQYQRDYAATGRRAPTWLSVANIVYVFIPIPLLPVVFNLLGAFISGVSGAPDIVHHPAYDAAVFYDPAATYWDLWLKEMDVSLFGTYPALSLRDYHSPSSVGVMMVCYLAYYVSPLVAVLPQILRRDWRRVRRLAAIYGGTLLATYVGYIAVPATGPRFEGTFEAWRTEGWFATSWWQGVLDNAEVIRWDAWPSGHVAIAVVSLVLALRYHRKVGLLYAPFVGGLILATVFLGYHYVTDVVAGLLFAALAFVVIEPLVRWWEDVWNMPRLRDRD